MVPSVHYSRGSDSGVLLISFLRGKVRGVVCAKFSKLVMAGGLAEPGSKLASLCSIGQTHPFVPTCLPAERRAQPRSRLAVGHRRRRRAAVWTAASTVPS